MKILLLIVTTILSFEVFASDESDSRVVELQNQVLSLQGEILAIKDGLISGLEIQELYWDGSLGYSLANCRERKAIILELSNDDLVFQADCSIKLINKGWLEDTYRATLKSKVTIKKKFVPTSTGPSDDYKK